MVGTTDYRVYEEDPFLTIQRGAPCTPSVGVPPMASFIRTQDLVPAYIATIMYNQTLPENVYGYELIYQSTHIAVYTMEYTAIVGIRGTSIGGKDAIQDLLDDIEIAFGEGCDLQIRIEAKYILEDMVSQGYRVVLCGHSLGGRAAICLSDLPGVINTVALNAGAPATNPDTKSGGGPGTHYHIVGDFISTHVYNMETVRVQMQFPVDWLDLWNHSTNRFLGGDPWKYVSAQEEQNDLEDFMFNRGVFKLRLASYATSILGFSWFIKARDQVCEYPIEGAVSSTPCEARKKSNFDAIGAGVSAGIGALIGLFAGPLGALAGFFVGKGIYEGNIVGVLDAIVPGFSVLSEGSKLILLDAINKSRGASDLVKKLKKIDPKKITTVDTSASLVTGVRIITPQDIFGK